MGMAALAVLLTGCCGGPVMKTISRLESQAVIQIAAENVGESDRTVTLTDRADVEQLAATIPLDHFDATSPAGKVGWDAPVRIRFFRNGQTMSILTDGEKYFINDGGPERTIRDPDKLRAMLERLAPRLKPAAGVPTTAR
jgi:hypothetical protein